MANDKDFVVNGPVVVGKDTKVTVGTIAAGTVDLSTGNYFTDSPSGDYTYTFANPGAVQAFQIEATGGSGAVAQTFSTTLYTGTGAAQGIDNGLDLAGDGGLVWMKSRTGTDENTLMDTERGIGSYLDSASTSGNQGTSNVYITSYNSNGFSVGLGNQINRSGEDFVSWSFEKQTKFFDIVTYTGNGTNNRNIAHSLGNNPGFIMVKTTSHGGDWVCWHSSLGTDGILLNSANAKSGYTAVVNYLSQSTSSNLIVGTNDLNESGRTYVAYIFAHDTASDGLIKCGSYATTNVGAATVNLGWKPQWLLAKRADGTGNWTIADTTRVWSDADSDVLRANTSAAESNAWGGNLYPTETGFEDNGVIGNSATVIYMAIRSAAAPAITWPSSIKWTQGSTPKSPAEGETDVYTFTTDDGGTTYTGIQSIDNAS